MYLQHTVSLLGYVCAHWLLKQPVATSHEVNTIFSSLPSLCSVEGTVKAILKTIGSGWMKDKAVPEAREPPWVLHL